MEYGFVKVASAVPTVKVADCRHNAWQMAEMIADAANQNVEIIIFPELSITGYTCGDLFAQSVLLEEAEKSLEWLVAETQSLPVISIVGIPHPHNGSLINAAVVFQSGKILGVVPKTFLPNYKEFYEKRWFASALQTPECVTSICGQRVPMQRDMLFATGNTTFGVEICEDLWSTIPPSSFLALEGAEIVFNMSADNDCVGKHSYLRNLVKQQSARCIAGYVFSSCGFGESTTDVVFAGTSIICDNGSIIAEGERFAMDRRMTVGEIDVESIRNDRRVNTTFSESRGLHSRQAVTINALPQTPSALNLTRAVNPLPFVPSGSKLDSYCEEIFAIQSTGLAQRFAHTHSETAVIGISGGLDSTLALLVAVNTFDKLHKDRKNIIGVTMPGFGTTDRTYTNALCLMKSLGVTIREISIKDSCIQHFNDIGHDINVHDVTYENSQARERTQLLMDIANQRNGMVIGTGDLSELALGWATYNGDHMSMYGVNASVPKTLVKHLVAWIANRLDDEKAKTTLLDIVDTPISPELIPADKNGNIKQKTEDIVGPYELHDFFLYNLLRHGFSPKKIFALAQIAFDGEFDNATIKKWLTTFCRRFFNQQFKRSCLPDGPKIGLSLSPRGDWRMPSDATSRLWLDECEKL
jgi:NAD+ synthase (glutamine-hydrolysing)